MFLRIIYAFTPTYLDSRQRFDDKLILIVFIIFILCSGLDISVVGYINQIFIPISIFMCLFYLNVNKAHNKVPITGMPVFG